jgi:trans-aconitate methyltransferase
MEPTEFWSGEDGNEYHARNWVNWRWRIPFWETTIDETGARSVLEFGCGPGWNLSAIKRAYPDVEVKGHEINAKATEQAIAAGLDVREWEHTIPISDLAFTVGCLIHIPPDKIQETMKGLIDSSYKYVLSIEYESEVEEEIEYRGQQGLLWKRPYGKMYEDLGLTELVSGEVGPGDGFDNCVFRLMSK